MEECIKLSEEVVDGRAGGGGHLSALAVLRAVSSSNDDLVGVEGAAKALADIMIINNYCVEANAYVPCAVRSKQKPMLAPQKNVATDNQWLSILDIFCVVVEAHGNANAFWEEDALELLQSAQKVPMVMW